MATGGLIEGIVKCYTGKNILKKHLFLYILSIIVTFPFMIAYENTNGNDAEVYRRHHGRTVKGQQSLRLDKQAIEMTGGLLKLLFLMFFSDICLHYPDRSYIFLNACIQIVITVKHFTEDNGSFLHDK